MTELEIFLEKHKNLEFPKHPDNSALEDWIFKLLEVDAYYYGLISGERNRILNKKLFHELEKGLLEISGLSASDREIYRHCLGYLNSIKTLIDVYHCRST